VTARPSTGRERRRAPVGLVLAVVMTAGAACASTPPRSGGGGTATTTSTTVTAAHACGVVPGAGFTITSSPEPCALRTRVGVTVHVALPSGFTWGDPHSDGGAVVVEGVARPPAGGLTAALVAVAVGRATVRATGTVACAPGQPCPQLARLWQVQVTVAP